MSSPDYPLLGLPGNDSYQLAYLASYVAETLARHRRAPRGPRGRSTRTGAVRDLAGAATALSAATGADITRDTMPRPLDRATFRAAQAIPADPDERRVRVVALDGIGRDGWAVLGQVPGLGDISAHVPTHELAEALRQQFLTGTVAELKPWAVLRRDQRVPTLPESIDHAAFVEGLDPTSAAGRSIARWLRGHSRRTDLAIAGRFTGVDLDAPTSGPPAARATRPHSAPTVPQPPTSSRPTLRSPTAAAQR